MERGEGGTTTVTSTGTEENLGVFVERGKVLCWKLVRRETNFDKESDDWRGGLSTWTNQLGLVESLYLFDRESFTSLESTGFSCPG